MRCGLCVSSETILPPNLHICRGERVFIGCMNINGVFHQRDTEQADAHKMINSAGGRGAGLIKKGAIQTRYYARKSVLLFDLLSLCTVPYVPAVLCCFSFPPCPHRFTNRMGGRIYIWGSSLLHQVSWNVWHGKNIDRKTLMDAERDGDGLGGLSWAVGCCFVCLVSSEIPSPFPTSWPVCPFGGIPKSFCLAAL